MKPRITICLLVLVLMSFKDPSLLKRIQDDQFRYEFYTIKDEVTFKKGKVYFWFRAGKIHHTEQGGAGELLHESYKKYYLSDQLAQMGNFKKGLKTGMWKSWYENGLIKSTQGWFNGLRSGTYYLYDEKGEVTVQGHYKSGLKHGKWIDYVKKDTLNFKMGDLVKPKVVLTREQKKALKDQKRKEKLQKKINKLQSVKRGKSKKRKSNISSEKKNEKESSKGEVETNKSTNN